jgi:MarR family transcriptional regulator, organic hydroperoxide resistance regulator
MAVDEVRATSLCPVMAVSGQVTGRMQEGLERLDLTGLTANLL